VGRGDAATVQQRMKSVGNIAKITSAMKMVAASRLRGAQTRCEAARGLWIPGTKLLGDCPGTQPAPPNITHHRSPPPTRVYSSSCSHPTQRSSSKL
jgi:F0F1-type ATP synthase gamma subunit